MRNRTHVAAEQGWEIFRTAKEPPVRERINQQLQTLGLPAVSERMYDHYRRLSRKGLRRYVPINQFDVSRRREN
jgi:hypothetical protein